MTIDQLLEKTAAIGASDLHITVGLPPMVRNNGKLKPLTNVRVTPSVSMDYAKAITNNEQWNQLVDKGECDFSISVPGKYRYRVNAYKQRQSIAIALRHINSNPPRIEHLGLPPVVSSLTNYNRGLLLVTGPTGSGKSTTLAAMINSINETRNRHVITLEDPIEYLHTHKKCIINQREIGVDSENYSMALRAALRQDPDIILVGEMRDLETISIALTAAETGHLVLSTLHTTGAAKTIDRVIDVFPPHQQSQIRMQLSMTLVGIVSQQLLIGLDGKRVCAVEALLATSAIRNLIRENKVHQIASSMQASSSSGMTLMDDSLASLYRSEKISRDTAIAYSIDKNYIQTLI